MTIYTKNNGIKWKRFRSEKTSFFTSADNLITAYKKGLLDMSKIAINEFKTKYEFFENGVKVAEFINDNSFGFCTQAYGVKLLN
jgi:hypothetical protein